MPHPHITYTKLPDPMSAFCRREIEDMVNDATGGMRLVTLLLIICGLILLLMPAWLIWRQM